MVRVSGNTVKYVFGQTSIRTSVVDPIVSYPVYKLNNVSSRFLTNTW